MNARVFLVVAFAAGAVRAPAQTTRTIVPAPTLKLVEEWRIDARKAGLKNAGTLAVAPDGRVIIAPLLGRGDGVVAYDSTGTNVLWKLATGWNRNLDIRYVNRIGWTGPQLWISDPGYDQIALVDANGRVTKSLEMPSMVRPTLGELRKFPVFGSMDPLARYADGSMLVRPLRERNMFDTPEFDSTAAHLLRVSSSGIITQDVAQYEPDAAFTVRVAKATATRSVPLQNRTVWNVSFDGLRMAFVKASMSGRDSATMGIVVLNERGDSVFSRRYPFKTVPIADESRDSALALNGRPMDGISAAQMRDSLKKRMPPFYAPVRSLFFGRDRSMWLALAPLPGDSTHSRLVLDPRGEVIGAVTVKRNVVIVAGDQSHMWVFEREGSDVAAIVRYRMNK